MNVVTLKFCLLHITAQPEFGIFMKLLYKSVWSTLESSPLFKVYLTEYTPVLQSSTVFGQKANKSYDVPLLDWDREPKVWTLTSL